MLALLTCKFVQTDHPSRINRAIVDPRGKPHSRPKQLIKNIGTLSVQELFFQLNGLLGVRLNVSPVGMVELFVHGASLTTLPAPCYD